MGISNESPKWNYNYYNELIKCKMALNLSRGKPLKYASSNRIATYVGNGILSSAGILIKKNVPNAKKISIICDKGVPNRLLKKLQKSLRKFNPKTYKFLANEKSKNFKTINKMVEILLKDNLSIQSGLFYAFSTLICVPTSRSQEVGLQLGAQAGEKRLRSVLNEAGFSNIERRCLEIE